MTARVLAVVLAESVTTLPALLDAVGEQTVLPDTLVGVLDHRPPTEPPSADADELDRLLQAVCDRVAPVPAGAPLSRRLAAALTAAPAPAEGERRWLWILDDAGIPATTALEELLAQADADPEALLIGAKQLRTDETLIDVGLSVTPWGRPVAGVEVGEIDQGQHDHRGPVLAVNSSGMLIDEALYRRLRGPDPALSGVMADVDLGRRANVSGAGVRVAPRAVVTRVREVAGRDAAAPGGEPLPPSMRGEQVHYRMVTEPLVVLPWVALTAFVGALARVVLGLASADTMGGLRGCGSALAALTRVDRIRAGRALPFRRASSDARRRLAELGAGTEDAWRYHRERHQRASESDTGSNAAVLAPAVLRDRPCDEVEARRRRTTLRGGRPAPGTTRARARRNNLLGLVMVATGLVGVLTFARTWGPGTLTGAALPPLPSSWRPLLSALATDWRDIGLGVEGPADPLLGPLAVLSPLTLGNPYRLVQIVLVIAPGIAAGAGWALAAAFRASTRWRILSALTWAASPTLLVATAQGRIGAVFAHLGLGLGAAALVASLGTTRRRMSWAWAAVAGLCFWLAVAGAPVLLVPVTVVVCGLAWWAHSSLPALSLALPWAGVAPLALPEVVRLLGDPGTPAHARPFSTWLALLGWPGWPGPWPDDAPGDLLTTLALCLGAVPLLLALAALPLAVSAHRGAESARWSLAVVALGMLTAWASASVTLGLTTSGGRVEPVIGWPGSGTSLVQLGLLLLILIAYPSGAAISVLSRGTWRLDARAGNARVVTLALVGVLVAVPMAALGGWAWLIRNSPPVGTLTKGGFEIPASAAAVSASSDHTRILVVRPLAPANAGATGGETAAGSIPRLSLVRGTGPQLQDVAVSATVTEHRRSADDVALSTLDQGFVDVATGVRDPREALSAFGIGAIAVLPGQGGDTLRARLASTPGLLEIGELNGVRAFRVLAPSGYAADLPDRPAALRLVPDSGSGEGPASSWTALPWRVQPTPGWRGLLGSRSVVTTVEADSPAATLHTSFRVSRDWRASLAGKPLQSTTLDEWEQGFVVPAGGGRLEMTFVDPFHQLWLVAVLLVLGVTVMLAVPIRGARG